MEEGLDLVSWLSIPPRKGLSIPSRGGFQTIVRSPAALIDVPAGQVEAEEAAAVSYRYDADGAAAGKWVKDNAGNR